MASGKLVVVMTTPLKLSVKFTSAECCVKPGKSVGGGPVWETVTVVDPIEYP